MNRTLLYVGVGVLLALLLFGGLEMPKSIFDKLAQAIMEFEGYFEGSVSYRNNNPGNLKFRNQEGAIDQDNQGHAIFDSFQSGYNALVNQIKLMFGVGGSSAIYNPSMSLYEVFKRYAEANSTQYAEHVASRLGVSPHTRLQDLV